MPERWMYCSECRRWRGCTHAETCTLEVACPECGGEPLVVLTGDPSMTTS